MCMLFHMPLCTRYPHLKKQGRTVVFKREPPEGEEDTFEFTEEELEEGPEQLSSLEADTEVAGGTAWSPLFSSSAEHVKHQVSRRIWCSRSSSSSSKSIREQLAA